MFKLQTPKATVLSCDEQKFFKNQKWATYDQMKKMVVCDTKKGKMTLLKGCNIRYETENCDKKLKHYRTLQNYIQLIDKTFYLVGYNFVNTTEEYEYEKIEEFDSFIKHCIKTKLYNKFQDQLFQLISYLYLIHTPVSQEGALRSDYRDSCLCIYDRDHEGRIKLLDTLSIHIEQLINLIGGGWSSSKKLSSIHINDSKFMISKCQINTPTLLGLYSLSKLFNLTDLNSVQVSDIKNMIVRLSLYVDDVVNQLINTLINEHTIKIKNNGDIQFNLVEQELGSSLYSLLKDKLEHRLKQLIEVNIVSILKNMDTYLDGRGLVSSNGIEFDQPKLIQYIEDKTGIFIEPDYFSNILYPQYAQDMYKACTDAFWAYNKGQLKDLCDIVDKTNLPDHIKKQIQDVCDAFFNKEELKTLSTTPIVKSEWIIKSKNYILTNGKKASGILKDDIEFIAPEMIIELIQSIKTKTKEVYNRKRKHNEPELEF